LSISYGAVQGQQEAKKDSFKLRLLLREPVEGSTSYTFTFPTEDKHGDAKNLIMKKVKRNSDLLVVVTHAHSSPTPSIMTDFLALAH